MLCEGPRCRNGKSRVRQAEPGARLCASCREALAAQLALLPELYLRCEGMLVTRRLRAIERVRGGLPGGINLNDAAVTARAGMLTVLASWAGLVVDERQLSRPPQRDVSDLTGFLLRHLGWLAAHTAAGEAAAEIAGLVRAAEDTASPTTGARVELGPCDQSGCDRTVSVTVSAGSADNEPAPHQISCDGGHVWLPHQWLLLKHRIERSRRAA